MTRELFTDPLPTSDDVLERVGELLGTAIRRQFWLLFLDSGGHQLRTLVPIDGIPEAPGLEEALRFAPMLDWLAEGEGAAAVVFVVERPGPREFAATDLAWARVLAEAASIIGLPTRALLLLHSEGPRPLTADDYA